MTFPLLDRQKILILGANGQVGRALKKLLPKATALDRSQADLNQPEKLTAVLNEYEPNIVINAAAYTAVDLAEKELETAKRVNGEAPGILARWCADQSAVLVHYSTDYVFPGTGTDPWRESDKVSPLNAYGQTKLEGEQNIVRTFYSHGLDKSRYLIFRTSWVFDSEGKNFLLTMLKLGRDKPALKIVGDQIGAPTFAQDLALQTLVALEKGIKEIPFPSGVYHFAQTGETSWFGFANAIFEEARKAGMKLAVQDVTSIPSSEYPTPAKRPLNSRLDCTKAQDRFGITFRGWRLALKDCILQVAEREKNS